jgi:hypothetical protein
VRKGPNPFLLLGMFVAASSTFFILTERRNKDPAHKRGTYHGVSTPMHAEHVDMPTRRPVE